MNYKDLGVALGIDALDLLESPVSAALIASGVGIPLGIGLNSALDAVQAGLAYWYFRDPIYAATLGELALPPFLDMFPSTTAVFLGREWGFLP